MIRPPFNYYGGKSKLATHIASVFPAGKQRYADVCCGSAAPLFAAPLFAEESLTDLNGWPLNALTVIRDAPEDLLAALPASVSKKEWRTHQQRLTSGAVADGMDDAVSAIVCYATSWNASPWSNYYSTKMAAQYERSMQSERMFERIRAASVRLYRTRIFPADAVELIYAEADSDLLIFCDPPYVFSAERGGQEGGSRGAAWRGYGPQEPNDEWHNSLIDAMAYQIDRGGAVVMTTGDDALYKEALPEIGMRLIDLHGTKGSGKGRGGIATSRHLLWSSTNGVLDAPQT